MDFLTLSDIEVSSKTVFLRADFNVVLDGKQIITDDTRIQETLPTINYLIENNCKIVIGSHLGRPKGEVNPKYSLLPVAERLSEILGQDVIFSEDCLSNGNRKLAQEMRPGQILLLENLRFYKEEEDNDSLFAEKLAQLGDVYINDAFGCCHRSHASMTKLADYFSEKCIGLLVENEINNLSHLVQNPDKPFVAILGGAKVSDKIGIIESLMNTVDTFLIGGGMAYTFLKAKGVCIGKSILENGKLSLAEKILIKAQKKGVEIILPLDSIITEELKDGTPWSKQSHQDTLGDQMGVDIGPETIALFSEKIKSAKTVFWNGPMGVFEIPPFNQGTNEVAHQVSLNQGTTIVGGGDSLAAIKASGYEDKISHLSTGGGASLKFLEGSVLPGLKVLEKKEMVA